MADEEFRHPRLAAIYDALDPDRSDLDAYVELIDGLGARRVFDVGCGTGTLALMLADRGCDVVGVDVAAASVAIARGKATAGGKEIARGQDTARRVRWVEGDAGAARAVDQDVAVMTANVAQAIAEPAAWDATLRAIHTALRPGGHLIFETRDPARRAWQRWTRDQTYESSTIAGVGPVTSWTEVLAVDGPLVTFRSTFVFAADAEVLTSTTTLRFRPRGEVEADLRRHGFTVVDVRDAPDRPGRELVFLAQRPLS